MTRLPQPGKDIGTWGGILNDFLTTAHNPDGSLKSSALRILDSSITTPQLADNAVSNAKLDVATQTTLATVASKYTKPAGGVPLTDLSSSLRANLTKAGTSVQQVNNKTPDGSGALALTAADVGAVTTLGGLSDVNATGATNSQVLSYNTGSSKWTAATVTSTTVSDASNTTKGILQLAGDLGGTAASPTVAKLSGVSLAGLATGLLKNTTGTGVPSIATASDIPDLSATYATAMALTTEASTARAAESKAVPRWAPTTTYTLGQQVVSPNNDVVSALAGFTSGASYVPSNWAVSSTFARLAPPPSGGDDTAILQAWHDEAPIGSTIELRDGDYQVSTLTVSKPLKLRGPGPGTPTGNSTAPTLTVGAGARLVSTSLTAPALVIASDGVVLEDLSVVNTAATPPTAGTGISITHGSHMKMRGVTVSGFWVNVDYTSTSGYYWTMAECLILDPVKYGIWIRNTNPTFDWADPSITQTTITNYTSRTPDAAVRWESGGGLRFVNNKINSGPSGGGLAGKFGVGLDWAVADGVATVDLIVTGNSLENCTTAMIRVALAGPSYTGYFSNIVITGNEIGFGYSSCTGIILNGHTTGNITNIVITGNVFVNLPSDSIYAEYMTSVAIGANTHEAIVGALVHLGLDCRAVDIHPQNNRDTNQILLTDDTSAGFAYSGPFGHIDHTYVRGVPAITTSYVELFQFDVPLYGSGRIDLTLTGQVQLVGSMFRKKCGYYFRDGGTVTFGAYDIDITGGTSTLDLNFDVSTAGTVKVQAKLPTGSTGTGLAGPMTLRLDGAVSRVLRS